MSSSSSLFKKCYNSECTEGVRSGNSRKAWRLRSGEFAELCNRCGSAYEEGRYCETVHLKASGWRSCESCGKRVHCGCIVSIHAFVLLDAGGVECMPCARKNIVLTTNSERPSQSLLLPIRSDRLKDLSTKNWTQISGAGPVPWRQAPSLFSTSIPQSNLHTSVPQSNLHPRTSYEVDMSTTNDRRNVNANLSMSSTEKKNNEIFSVRLKNGILYNGTPEIQENGHSGMNCNDRIDLPPNVPPHMTVVKDDPSRPCFGLPVPHVSANENNGVFSGEVKIRNGKPRGEGCGKNQMLSRYCPKATDQELRQFSGHPNSVIIPLFEKTLSVSDAGKIGRLVLPKKCAEAYLPLVHEAEGLPLRVQDVNGQEWVFQYRFWPNSNSRMYVLEGVTPCIQSLQLQAGDVVTFSRMEPEGKLLMGFRKASTAPSSAQGGEMKRIRNAVPKHEDAELVDPTMTWSKVGKSGFIAKDVTAAKSPTPRKRKNNTFSLRSKRLQIDNMDQIELKISWEEAQGLLRPPSNRTPSVVVIEGFEFEEYQDAPVIGKPTIFTTGRVGENIQWAQCEDCSKWRKLPSDALLSSRWTCSQNLWDPRRSICSAAQEINAEQIDDLLPANSLATCKKLKVDEQDTDGGVVEALEGLDSDDIRTSSSSQAATTKHPRHRLGCTCIVCVQAPSGKFPKHKQSCTCMVCLSVKRRFHTLMLKRESKEKQSETEGETVNIRKHADELNSVQLWLDEDDILDDENMKKMSGSPFKGQIDLNIQPERDDEPSPTSDSGSMMRLLHDATERCLRQQRLLNSGGRSSHFIRTDGQIDDGSIKLDPTHHKSDVSQPLNLSAEAVMLDSLQPRDR